MAVVRIVQPHFDAVRDVLLVEEELGLIERHVEEDAVIILQPGVDEIAEIRARLDRLDASSSYGAWTRETLDLIDLNPTVRAPDLAAKVGRETADFKKDVRKLKELGLTESLAIGYLLSPRGEAVVDAGLAEPRVRAPRATGAPLPRSIGAPATRALREAGVTTLEQLPAYSAEQLAAMHGVGPIAIARLREALAEQGAGLAGG